MDNNNPSLQPQPAANIPLPQSPIPQTPLPAAAPESGDSKKIIIYFVVGIIVIALLIGGAYLFLSTQQSNTETQKQPIVEAKPKEQDTVDALDKDLESLEIANTDSDFSTVDEDLQQL